MKCPGCFQEISGQPSRCPICGESLAVTAGTTTERSRQTAGTSSASNMAGAANASTQSQSTGVTPPPRDPRQGQQSFRPAGDSFSSALGAAILNTFQIKGRLAKSPYLKVLAAEVLVWAIGYPLLYGVLGDSDEAGKWCIGLSMPFVTATVRRLHDTGRSGRCVWYFLTVIGIPVVLLLACQPTQPGPNRFGPAP